MEYGKLPIPTVAATLAALFLSSTLFAQGWPGDEPSTTPESGSGWGNSADDPWGDSPTSESEAAQDDPWETSEPTQDEATSDSGSSWGFQDSRPSSGPELSLTAPKMGGSWRVAGYSGSDFTLNLEDFGLNLSAELEIGSESSSGDSEFGFAGGVGFHLLDGEIDLGLSLTDPDLYYRSYFRSATSTSRAFWEVRTNIAQSIDLNFGGSSGVEDLRLRLAAGAGYSHSIIEDVSLEIRGHFLYLNLLDGFEYQILGGLDDFHGDASTWDSFGSQSLEFGLAVRF